MTHFPTTIWRYFFRRYMMTFTAYSLAIILVILLVDFNETSRRLSGAAQYTILIGLYISSLRVPMVVQTAIPFIVLIASIATLIQLNRKYELVVTRAAGISVWQFLSPLVGANLLIGLFSITILNGLAANATALAENVLVDRNLGGLRRANEAASPWLRQRTEDGDTIIGARSSAEGGTRLGDVTFFRFDTSNNLTERLEARNVRLEDGQWRLSEATRYRAGEKAESVAEMTVPTNLKAEFVGETLASPDSVPFYLLPGKIAAARSYGLAANTYSMRLHWLIAQPALLAAMTLIAAMVSLNFVRFGQSISVILGGILAGFVLYVVSELIQAFGNAGTVPPIVAAWLPVLVASALGTTVLLHREDG